MFEQKKAGEQPRRNKIKLKTMYGCVWCNKHDAKRGEI